MVQASQGQVAEVCTCVEVDSCLFTVADVKVRQS